ncbi:MAG: TonB-dependent receptor [Ferruginibacter sp.]
MKKNHAYRWIYINPSVTKLLKIMKLTAILLFVCAMSVSAGGFSQDVKVSLSLNGVKLTKFFKAVEKETNYRFTFSNDIIPEGRIVTINVKEMLLSQVMTEVMSTTKLKYRFVEESGIFIISERTDNPLRDVEAAAVRTITGNVTSERGEPLSGVSVQVKGGGKATTTSSNGTFALDVEDNAKTLVFSFVGMVTREVSIEGKNSLQVVLQLSNKALDEVVVVGYGTQKRSTLTGAVSSVSSKTLNELPVAGIDQALQGRVAGLTVTNNGSPGTAPIVRIRGISSINFGADPLFVVDGFPTGNLASFDAKDVESVEVLKDASAAAIYGSRATSGVIMITTKKGKRDGRLTVNLDSYVGVQSPAKKIALLNTNQYLQYATALLGPTAVAGIGRLQSANFNKPVYTGASQTFAQTNTDWQDEYFVNNAMITQNNVSVSGGNAMSRFYSSAGYFKQDGIAQGLNYERGNFRLNSEHTISKMFTFGQNLYLAFGDQAFEGTGGNRSPLTNVVRMLPYLPARNPLNPGGFQGPNTSFDGSDPTNPVEAALIGFNTIKTLKVLGTAYADVNFTSWLKFRSTFGVDYSNAYQQQYTPIYNDGGEYVSGGTSSRTSAGITNQRQLYTTLLFTQQLTFDKTFKDHHVTATAVYEQQGQKFINETASGNQDNNTVKNLNGATNVAANSRLEENLIKSLIGRVTYDFAGKYLLSASLRRDGLSVFAPGHKFKNFPAASIGWKIDQENFMKNSTFISELKLRGGYGITGINGVLLGNYPYQVPVQSNQSDYPFNGAISGPNGSFYNNLANPNLEWETTKQTNIGLDLGLWRNQFTLTAEFFRRQTDNLIINVPIPPSFGFGSGVGVPTNAASMRNNGFELQLGYHKTSGEFKWDAGALLSIIRNRVLKLYTASSSFPAGADADFGNGDITNTVVGQPIQSFYGYVVESIFQSAAEVASSPTQVVSTPTSPGTSAGDIKFKDISGPAGKPDGKITADDRIFIGSYLPKFTYSFNYSASYKNFDASIFFQGVQGNKIFNAERVIVEGMIRLFNSGTQVLNAWTPTNTNTTIPRAISGDPNGNSRVSTRWIEDGSFLRLKNLMIGYNFPAIQSITKGTIKRLRLYVSSQNLVTFTKYKGWDPEVGTRRTTLTNGIDYGQYPSARSYQFGIQAGF